MSSTDLKGLAVSTTSSDALAAYERGVDLFLRWRSGAIDALDAAAQRDAHFALVHCTKAYITSRMGRADLATAAGRAALALADERTTSASGCTWAPSRRCSAATRWPPTMPSGGSRPGIRAIASPCASRG